MSEIQNSYLKNLSSLKAYYKGEDITDSSSGGNTLTNNNSVTFTTAKFGNGFNLGASNTNKSLAVASNLGITGRVFTMTCWVKLITEITTGTYIFLEHCNNTTDNFITIQYDFIAAPTIRLQQYKIGGGDAQVFATYTRSLGINDWHHLAHVSNGTNFYLYLDGIQRASGACPANGSFTTNNVFNIGYNNLSTLGSGPNLYASAIIDDVGVWDVAFTASDILSLYNSNMRKNVLRPAPFKPGNPR